MNIPNNKPSITAAARARQMLTTKTCAICEQPISGWGNNAYPLADGKCCDTCNDTMVVKARLERLTQKPALLA